MENAIDADQNFYSRRPLHQPPPQQPPQHQPQSQPHPRPQHQPLHQYEYPDQHETRRTSFYHHHHDPPPLPDFESRSPQLSPNPSVLTTANLQDFAANGYRDGLGMADGDPAEFYRDYRGAQPSGNGYTDIATNGMAATATGSRPPPSSFRSNGNGSLQRQPSVTARSMRPSYRSASSPLDDRMGPASPRSNAALNGMPRTQQASVKELLKRFDTNNEPSSSTPRKPTPRISTRDSTLGASGSALGGSRYMARTNIDSQQTASATRPGISTRDGGAGKITPPKATQKTRFANESQWSHNVHSGIPRSPSSRNSGSGNNPHGSKSMTNLSPTSPTSNPSSQTSLPGKQPLFGEVLTAGPGLDNIAYGIPHSATRRTSDSNLQLPNGAIQRSQSDAADSPSSPTAWYLGTTPALEDVVHNRNHSDLADMKVNTLNGVTPSFQTPTTSQPASPQRRTVSRLPVRTKRLSNSSESSSQPSPRAGSPFVTKSPPSGGKKHGSEQRPWSPGGRSATPTKSAAIPVHKSPRGRAQKAEAQKAEAQNNSSLPAYIKTPPLKTSPPLRSSRPRQPVSTATTTSSRHKTRDNSTSPKQGQTGMKITRNGRSQESATTKKPDLASIDFVAQRAKVRRAYTKSIHEAEQKEIRAANMRRLEERRAKDAAAVAKIEEEASQTRSDTPPIPTVEPQPETEPEREPGRQTPLQVATSFPIADPVTIQQDNAEVEDDSPTLGMTIPGSFVDYDEPASAISNATGITEIENEPQTEEGRLGRFPSVRHLQPSRLSSQIVFTAEDLSPEQALFGINQEQQESIDIMLSLTPAEGPSRKSSPGAGDDNQERRSNSEYNQPIFASTVTATTPGASPQRSRSASPYKFGDHASTEDDQVGPLEHNSYTGPPQASYAPGADYVESPDNLDAPRLEFPTLRTALAPPSLSISDAEHDYSNTPITDLEDEGFENVGISSSRNQRTYDDNNPARPFTQVNRSSHQSSWTDYSFDSAQDYTGDEDFYKPAPLSIASNSENSARVSPREPSSLSPKPPVLSKSEDYSPIPSPAFPVHSSRVPSPNGHHLPPVSTGDGFAEGFSQGARLSATSGPLWNDFTPPPHQAAESLREPSINPPPTRSPPPPNAYHTNQYEVDYSSESRRASDDAYSTRPSVSETRSSTQIAFEDVLAAHAATSKAEIPQTEEEKEAAAKQKRRLFKRRMIIKELIDTESVYLKDMNVVEEIYKGTAEACPKLDTGDIKAIFRNSEEIVEFSTTLLDDLKSAALAVYLPRAQKSRQSKAISGPPQTMSPGPDDRLSTATTLHENAQTDEQKDYSTYVGAAFGKHLQTMQTVYTDYLKNSETASARLATLQNDSSVKVWLSECNIVAKDLTAAWDLDALLVKPVQRITRYQLLFKEILDQTPEDHPDFEALQITVRELLAMLRNIDELKKRIEMVGKIVSNRKRKDSDVRTGLAKAFGRREKNAEKLQSNASRAQEDEIYMKLHEKYGDDYLRLQVVLRDVEFYTRQVSIYVNDFLRYLSAMELVMRLSASPWPEIESKWARFNMSMRDMSTVALEEHITSIRLRVIEPFEKVIQAYGPPGLAMKKRAKRRIDYEKSVLSKGSSIIKLNDKDSSKVDQYKALNETLKLELPKLSSLTEKIGNICLGNFVLIQSQWYSIWQKKVKTVLEESQIPKDIVDIVDMFNRDYKIVDAQAQELGIINGNFTGVPEKSGNGPKMSEGDSRKGRPSNLSTRSRGLSLSSDNTPSLPTPDFPKRLSGHFALSPTSATSNMPQFAYQPQSYSTGHSRAGSGSPATPDMMSQPRPSASSLARPSTGRSFTSDSGMQRISNDYSAPYRRESASTYSSNYQMDGPPVSARPFSGIFHSAMPMPDGPEDSQRSSRNSSRDRNFSGGYNVLYLAASLFEFNISATKTEAGYAYLTYSAGEIFDVIGEKGELWLAKNQDDASDTVGWIWSKHFARLAAD